MRDGLLALINKTILVKYKLPNDALGISKTSISSLDDYCLYGKKSIDLATIIYNGIIEYCENEYKIDYKNIDKEQLKAIQIKMNYIEDQTVSQKKQKGFYGEVLLFAILKVIFGADVLVAKGYFYNPIENSEAKGFDCYHLIDKDEQLELWFGEAKCGGDFKKPLTDILSKIQRTLSDEYLNKNILAINRQMDKSTNFSPRLMELLNEWEENPEINLSEQAKRHNIKLVYPILIIYNNKTSYDDSVKTIVQYVEDELVRLDVKTIGESVETEIFFIFFPVEEISSIKEEVITWISQKKPLI